MCVVQSSDARHAAEGIEVSADLRITQFEVVHSVHKTQVVNRACDFSIPQRPELEVAAQN